MLIILRCNYEYYKHMYSETKLDFDCSQKKKMKEST